MARDSTFQGDGIERDRISESPTSTPRSAISRTGKCREQRFTREKTVRASMQNASRPPPAPESLNASRYRGKARNTGDLLRVPVRPVMLPVKLVGSFRSGCRDVMSGR